MTTYEIPGDASIEVYDDNGTWLGCTTRWIGMGYRYTASAIPGAMGTPCDSLDAATAILRERVQDQVCQAMRAAYRLPILDRARHDRFTDDAGRAESIHQSYVLDTFEAHREGCRRLGIRSSRYYAD